MHSLKLITAKKLARLNELIRDPDEMEVKYGLLRCMKTYRHLYLRDATDFWKARGFTWGKLLRSTPSYFAGTPPPEYIEIDSVDCPNLQIFTHPEHVGEPVHTWFTECTGQPTLEALTKRDFSMTFKTPPLETTIENPDVTPIDPNDGHKLN